MLRCRAMNGQGRRVALAVGWLASSRRSVARGRRHRRRDGAPARDAVPGRADVSPATRRSSPASRRRSSELLELAGEVAELSDLGRKALAALVARDSRRARRRPSPRARTWRSRSQTPRRGDLREQLEACPGVGAGDELVLSAESPTRQELALGALDSTDGLGRGLVAPRRRSVAASRITGLLTDHDLTMRRGGRRSRTDRQIRRRPRAPRRVRPLIAEARALRDTLAAHGRRRDADAVARSQRRVRRGAAPPLLALIDSNGAVTAEVRAAFAAEAAARARLPADSKALVIILAEIGRGGLNQAVIRIEEARGELDAAIGLLGRPSRAAELPDAALTP